MSGLEITEFIRTVTFVSSQVMEAAGDSRKRLRSHRGKSLEGMVALPGWKEANTAVPTCRPIQRGICCCLQQQGQCRPVCSIFKRSSNSELLREIFLSLKKKKKKVTLDGPYKTYLQATFGLRTTNCQPLF